MGALDVYRDPRLLGLGPSRPEVVGSQGAYHRHQEQGELQKRLGVQSHLQSDELCLGPERLLEGNDDEFLQQGQLLPEAFQAACDEVGQPVQIRMHVSGEPSSETAWVGMLPHSLHSFHVWCLQDGYDHSYYFIQTHLGDHIEFHAEVLSQEAALPRPKQDGIDTTLEALQLRECDDQRVGNRHCREHQSEYRVPGVAEVPRVWRVRRILLQGRHLGVLVRRGGVRLHVAILGLRERALQRPIVPLLHPEVAVPAFPRRRNMPLPVSAASQATMSLFVQTNSFRFTLDFHRRTFARPFETRAAAQLAR
eukprot:scaffold434_cov186-Pinguiococcus_pyrenoidosus.AAC.29